MAAAVATIVPSVKSSHHSSSHSSPSGPARTANDVMAQIQAAETRSSLGSRSHAGSLILAPRHARTLEAIHAEIAALEAEVRARDSERRAFEERCRAMSVHGRPRSLRSEELVEERRTYGARGDDEVVLFDPWRHAYVVYESSPSPPRRVVRVMKDRKGRMALVRSSR